MREMHEPISTPSTFSPAPSGKPSPQPGAPVDAPMHPSWAAKQRAKEAQTAAKPQGKKIVFD